MSPGTWKQAPRRPDQGAAGTAGARWQAHPGRLACRIRTAPRASARCARSPPTSSRRPRPALPRSRLPRPLPRHANRPRPRPVHLRAPVQGQKQHAFALIRLHRPAHPRLEEEREALRGRQASLGRPHRPLPRCAPLDRPRPPHPLARRAQARRRRHLRRTHPPPALVHVTARLPPNPAFPRIPGFRTAAKAPNGLDAIAMAFRHPPIVNKHAPDPVLEQFVEAELGERVPEARMFLDKWFEEARQEGLLEGQPKSLLSLIHLNLGPPTATTEDRIRAADSDQLSRWTERILTADSLDALLDAPRGEWPPAKATHLRAPVQHRRQRAQAPLRHHRARSLSPRREGPGGRGGRRGSPGWRWRRGCGPLRRRGRRGRRGGRACR